MIRRIFRAARDMSERIFIAPERLEHGVLKRQAFFFGVRSSPALRVGLFAALDVRSRVVELGVIGVVGDGSGVPQRRMLPGRCSYDEGGLIGPRPHAAALPLADDFEVGLHQQNRRCLTEQPQRLARADAKASVAAHLNPFNIFLLTA